jgi:hypothetical protein
MTGCGMRKERHLNNGCTSFLANMVVYYAIVGFGDQQCGLVLSVSKSESQTSAGGVERNNQRHAPAKFKNKVKRS